MRFTMTIDLDNAAFEDNPHELQRIVCELSENLDNWGVNTKCFLLDCNGNRVGEWSIERHCLDT